MLAIIILVLVTLLVGNTFLSKKKTVSKKKKIVTIIISCVLIILVIYPLLYDGIKNTYCLSDDKCVTVWKRGNGEAYIIFGKHKGQKTPSDNYIQTTNDNSIIIIYEGDKEYDYVIFNNYGETININMENSKVKYYHYKEREDFYNKYYEAKFMKPQYKYLLINIKENFVILNGVEQ